MWKRGEWKKFCEMLPEYAVKGHGEGFMHDTAMMLGALGWSGYDGQAEIITPYFGASGTGQMNAVFPVTANDGGAIPAAGLGGAGLSGGQPATALKRRHGHAEEQYRACLTSSSSTRQPRSCRQPRAGGGW